MNNDIKALRNRVNQLRDFPHNTTAASRHLQAIADELAVEGACQMLIDEPDHCAESMYGVLAELWGQEFRDAETELQETQSRLDIALERLERTTQATGSAMQEVRSVLELMDGLAERWGDEGVFRRCRDRLRALVSQAAWQPMSTAPRDGTPIKAEIDGDDYVIGWQDGFLNSGGEDCGSWVILDDQEPPDSWSDGICWEHNEDGVSSVQPARWMPLP